MIPRPKIHPLAECHIRELKQKCGRELDLEDVVWIVQLCDAIINPSKGERSDLCGIPTRVGLSNTYLWKMTIGASVWLQDFAMKWWDGDPERQTTALAYALTHCRDKDAFRKVSYSKEKAEDTLKEWSLSCAFTREELEDALDIVLPTDNYTVKKNNQGTAEERGIDWVSISIELEALTGLPTERWTWDVSRDHTMLAYSNAKNSMAARVGGGTSSSVFDSLNTALTDLAKAKEYIIHCYKQEKDEQGT